MPKGYAREFRRATCARLVFGEKVSSLSKELEVSEAILYLWKRQALIDAGCAEGVKSFEADELAQAYKTIAELEAELEAVQAASALFRREEPVSPKSGARLPEARATWATQNAWPAGSMRSHAHATTSTSTTCRATARSVDSCSWALSPTPEPAQTPSRIGQQRSMPMVTRRHGVSLRRSIGRRFASRTTRQTSRSSEGVDMITFLGYDFPD